jgi:cold shock CspA family protein
MPPIPATDRIYRGVVSTFDFDRGLGTVADQHGVEIPFHCTAISDGTRRIEVGTPVEFVLAPGRAGRLQARTLVALTPG